MNQRVSSDFICESCAAITEHAPLTVEHDERRDIDRLLVVTLFFDVSALARTVAERWSVVGIRHLCRTPGNRADDLQAAARGFPPVPALLCPIRCRPSCPATPEPCTRLQHRSATGVDFDEALATHADR